MIECTELFKLLAVHSSNFLEISDHFEIATNFALSICCIDGSDEFVLMLMDLLDIFNWSLSLASSLRGFSKKFLDPRVGLHRTQGWSARSCCGDACYSRERASRNNEQLKVISASTSITRNWVCERIKIKAMQPFYLGSSLILPNLTPIVSKRARRIPFQAKLEAFDFSLERGKAFVPANSFLVVFISQ